MTENQKMENKRNELSERLLGFASLVIKLVAKLNKTDTERHIANQLIESATSAGANYEEACGAESRNDFIHKMQIVLKELRESQYRIRLIGKSDIYRGDDLNALLNEATELINIIAKSVITAKNNKK